MKAEHECLDAIIIGGNVRGLVTSYLLGSLGFRAALIEQGPRVGGADASFTAADGSLFEYGMHVLDDMRSEVATRLFTHVVDGEVNRVRLRRGLVMRGHLFPYAPLPAEMPAELRAMLPADELHDDLIDELPTRARLSECYGRQYADLIFDEVLPSYPSEHRHTHFGIDKAELLTNIYPWFFPRAGRSVRSGDASREFHYRKRGDEGQHILYPKQGGFGGFIEGFLRKLDTLRVEVMTSAPMVPEIDHDTHSFRSITVGGRRLRAEKYFWAGPWPQLCSIFDLPCQEVATDRILIGSFRLDRPAISEFHEILFGDPAAQVNRVYFPALFRRTDEALMQVEFAAPVLEDQPTDPEYWRERWLADLRRIGILDASHRVEMFDFKTRPMHFNGYGMEGERLRDADPSLLHLRSNVHPVVPSMANLNLNAHVPRTVELVAAVMSGASSAR
jgi:protoporphyrinogen oxidase